ncbi:MAG: CRISPR-associated ring nuclease Crn3/Csx3 [Methanothrix sp.]|nr:CRISPR-associated ring nuclease Crn3/Csx3 [Methanothrix sp.]
MGKLIPMAYIIYSIAALSPITPAEPLPSLPDIPRGSLVIVEGRAPIWRYGMALHLLHGSPAAAVAFYDPRLGAVVVATHSQEWTVGQVVDVTLPAEK